jgi:hypothetical protein
MSSNYIKNFLFEVVRGRGSGVGKESGKKREIRSQKLEVRSEKGKVSRKGPRGRRSGVGGQE